MMCMIDKNIADGTIKVNNNNERLISMKRLLLLLLVVIPMLFVYPLSADAMKMSKPIYLGCAEYSDAGGTHIDGAVVKTGKVVYTEVFDGERYTTYDKGYAVFGKGDLTIYAHYSDDYFRLGGKNMSNTLGAGGDITAIRTDSGIVFYQISGTGEGAGFAIIGKLPDGRFIQYADSHELNELYHWTYKGEMIEYGYARTENDVIIVPYYDAWSDPFDPNPKPEGEIRFAWDEKAQWFGVEKR